MNLLSDVITYIRRIIKAPGNAQITDALLIDYINRFWLLDVDARIQLFDLKTYYQFQTTPGRSNYNMPLYNLQTETGSQTINYYPVYQGFSQPAFVDGIQMPFYTEPTAFWNLWPNYLQFDANAGVGDGTTGPYTISVPFFPAVPGYVDMSGIIATGVNQDPPITNTLYTDIPESSIYSNVFFTATGPNGQNIVVADSGQYLGNNSDGDLYGLLYAPGVNQFNQPVAPNPFGYNALTGGYSTTLNTINYNSGVAHVTFPTAIPPGTPIQAQCYFYQQGLPRAILFYNNCLTIRPPPNTQYLLNLTAYLSPAAFLNSGQALQFAYMSEYIARGAARKILSDTGDVEQFQFYEPLFKEQEMLVWKRSQRQFTATRTGTIFSDLQGQSNYNSISQGST
jgi:hypothetical protein